MRGPLLDVSSATSVNAGTLLTSQYSWEFITSLSFDWQYISGKKKFKWPLVRLFPFALRSLNAHVVYTYRSSTSRAAIACSSRSSACKSHSCSL